MRRLAYFILSLGAIALPDSAAAYPFVPVRQVPGAIAGPTDPHVAATVYNPAALGPHAGLHVFFDASAHLNVGSIQRDPVEGRAVPSTNVLWANPDGFVGVSWKPARFEQVTFGLSVNTASFDLTRYDDTSAARYHAIWNRAVTIEQILSAAFRIHPRFYIGAGLNIYESIVDYRYSRDAVLAGGSQAVDQGGGLCGAEPCGLENPLAAQDIRLRGFAYTANFSLGVLVRPIDRLWLGVSYRRGAQLQMGSDNGATVRPAPGQGLDGVARGSAVLTTSVPDVMQLGIRIEISSRLEFAGHARWVHYGTPQLLASAQGSAISALATLPGTAIPPAYRIDRGMIDAISAGAALRIRVGDKLRLAPSITVESSAVETVAINPGSIDGPKLDTALVLEWHPTKHLLIGANLGVTSYLVSRIDSRFNPREQVNCVDVSYNLDACRSTYYGGAIPNASGRYLVGVITGGLALGADF